MAETPQKIPKEKRSRTLLWFTAFLLIVALVWFFYWLLYLRFYQYTDDAYSNGNMISINSAVSGSVVAFFADDTDLVTEGQLLIQLDSIPYEMAYNKELATLASTVLQVRQLFDEVEVNKAALDNRKAALSKAQYDFDNRRQLVSSSAISNEDFIHAKDDLTIAEANLRQAEEQLNVSLAAAGNTTLEKHPLIEQQKNSVRTAFYNLWHCFIYAPATGYVAQRTVNVGQWISPSTNTMAVIPINYVWVDANYKETQLGSMRIGQPARVWLDLYGSKVEYQGKILGIASGSGSVFSLIPPQNATGNWIKIVQRLPVRISLDPKTVEKFPVRLGLSAEVDVDITDQNLPRLAPVPFTKPIGITTVFDIDLEKLEKVIDQIIKENLLKTIT